MKCIDCRKCHTFTDPDPHDWFCDDNQAMVCTATKEWTLIEDMLRPYEVKDVEAPSWCPLLSENQ
jgi:hypothetical protein